MNNKYGFKGRLGMSFLQGLGCGVGIDIITPVLHTNIFAKAAGLLAIAASYPTPPNSKWAKANPQTSNVVTVFGFAAGLIVGYETGENILKAVFRIQNEPSLPSIPARSDPGIMAFYGNERYKAITPGYNLHHTG